MPSAPCWPQRASPGSSVSGTTRQSARAGVFALGLILYAACAPLVGWAMLAYPSGRLTSWAERVVVSVAMAGSLLVLGLLPTLFFDPVARGCLQCPENPLLLLDEPALYDDLNRVGVQLGLMWSLLLIAVAGWGLARSSRDPAARCRAGCRRRLHLPRPRRCDVRREP